MMRLCTCLLWGALLMASVPVWGESVPATGDDGASLTPGPTVTLSEALSRTAEQNIELRMARLEIDKARAGLKKAMGMLLPAAQIQFEYRRMDHEDRVDMTEGLAPLLNALPIALPPDALPDPLLVNPQNRLTGALQVMVPLIHPEGWLTVRTARKGIDVAEHAVDGARRQLLMGTAQAYFLAVSCLELIDFYHTQIQTANAQVRVAETRFENGQGLRVDVIRAHTDRENARQSLLSAQLALDNARDVLRYLTGMDELPLPARDTALRPASDADSTGEDTSRRADIRQAAATVTLREHQLRTSKMQFLPYLTAAFQGSYQFTEMPDLGSSDRSRWAMMLTLTIPLYNHFRYGELDERRAELAQAEYALFAATQKASLGIRKARRDYHAALTQVAIARQQQALAAEGLRLVEAAYRTGADDSLSVTTARQTYTDAGFNLTMMEMKARLALLDLLDAQGADRFAE
jgi:outer membrane protein TolC